ncbi:MAG: amidohydrolase family protein, partial [Pseudomonadota bacterium]
MADLVILNGRAITFDGSGDGPDAEAVAITGGVIEAVGTTAEIRELAAGARVIDAGGCTILPGFIDSHVHFFGGSAHLDKLDLTEVSGLGALATAARAYAATRPEGEMICGVACDYHLIDGRSVTRRELDAALPDRPFLAMAADHHTAWANTRALEMAGLLHGAPMPEGSEVVMGADGTATGEL